VKGLCSLPLSYVEISGTHMPRTIQGWIKIDRRAAPSTETSEREREREREHS